MNIIFEYEQKRLILPVNPEEVKVSIPSSSNKVNVLGVGQVSIPQDADLAKISIQSFFWKYLFDNSILRYAEAYINSSSTVGSSILSGISSADTKLKDLTGTGLIDDSKKFKLLNEYVQWFRTWQQSKKPARWTIVVPPDEPPQCFDFNVTCENFNYKIIAGEETDYYYEIELQEFRNYGAEKIESKTDSTGNTINTKNTHNRLSSTKSATPTSVNVTSKDNLWSVAKKYGSKTKNKVGDNWKILYSMPANKSIIANNIHNLTGQKLQMPTEWL